MRLINPQTDPKSIRCHLCGEPAVECRTLESSEVHTVQVCLCKSCNYITTDHVLDFIGMGEQNGAA